MIGNLNIKSSEPNFLCDCSKSGFISNPSCYSSKINGISIEDGQTKEVSSNLKVKYNFEGAGVYCGVSNEVTYDGTFKKDEHWTNV